MMDAIKKPYNLLLAMKPDSRNIVLKFDSASLARIHKLLNDYVLRVETILSLDGSDDESILENSPLELENEFYLAAKDSALQYISMLQALYRMVLSNGHELGAFEERVVGAERILSKKARNTVEEIHAALNGRKSELTSEGKRLLWGINDISTIKQVLLLTRHIAYQLAHSWLTALEELMGSFELTMPPSLDRVHKKRRKRKVIEVLGWISLVLALVAFFPPLAIPAGVAAIVWFFVERRFFSKSELKELKAEGRLLKETRDSVKLALGKLSAFQLEVAPWNAESFSELVSPVLEPLENNTPPDMHRIEVLKVVLEAAAKEMSLITARVSQSTPMGGDGMQNEI